MVNQNTINRKNYADVKKNFIVFLVTIGLSFLLPQVQLAFTIGTGLGILDLQKKINNIQTNAIEESLTKSDKKFLTQFYRTLAYGAEATILLGESARLMHHYLCGSGKQTSIDVSLFTKSFPVKKRMKSIRKNLKKMCVNGAREVSGRFDMGYNYPPDSAFALYFGTIEGKIQNDHHDKKIQWTARMPWKWPTYETIKRKYGTYFAESFPIPNALSLVKMGPSLSLPNALGGELENQGLAKSFKTKTVWTEKLSCS